MKDFLEVMEMGDRLETSLSERATRIENFVEKFAGFLRLIGNLGPQGQKGWYKGHERTYLMKEAETTSDFPTLFGTVLERRLLAAYKIQDADWRTYVKAGTQNDFRKANLLTLYGLQSKLSNVLEQAEYVNDKYNEGTKVEIQLAKFGRQFRISWEALINDDLGGFADAVQRLARAASVTEAYNATATFVASTGPATGLFSTSYTHPIDGATGLSNKGTDVLSATALETVFGAMTSQVDRDGNPILITKFHVVVPPKKYIPALRALAPDALIANGVGSSASTTSSKNVIASMPFDIHMNPYLPIIDTTHGDTSWYVFADPSQDGVAVQQNFLAGHENPEIVQKASNKLSVGGGAVPVTEGDFESDSAAWRLRHIMGSAIVDPRFAYAEAATT